MSFIKNKYSFLKRSSTMEILKRPLFKDRPQPRFEIHVRVRILSTLTNMSAKIFVKRSHRSSSRRKLSICIVFLIRPVDRGTIVGSVKARAPGRAFIFLDRPIGRLPFEMESLFTRLSGETRGVIGAPMRPPENGILSRGQTLE